MEKRKKETKGKEAKEKKGKGKKTNEEKVIKRKEEKGKKIKEMIALERNSALSEVSNLEFFHQFVLVLLDFFI